MRGSFKLKCWRPVAKKILCKIPLKPKILILRDFITTHRLIVVAVFMTMNNKKYSFKTNMFSACQSLSWGFERENMIWVKPRNANYSITIRPCDEVVTVLILNSRGCKRHGGTVVRSMRWMVPSSSRRVFCLIIVYLRKLHMTTWVRRKDYLVERSIDNLIV